MNDIAPPTTTSTASKVAWYFNTSLVQVLLILLFPIGFTLMWLGRVFSARTRWIVTGFLGLFIVSLMSTKAPQKGADLAVSPNVVSSPASPGVALVAEKPALIDEALLAAIRASNKDQVAAILDQAPALVKSADKSGFTPLHAAAVFTTDDGAIIRLLVARGADLHAIRDPGSTPLWWAVIHRPRWRSCWNSVRSRTSMGRCATPR